MRYLGSKNRISKDISNIINYIIENNDIENFVSLFCGSCAIEFKVKCKNKILNDKHEYLIEMFNGIKNGYELPDVITKEQYIDIKNNKDRDRVLSGFVGFGCSFSGKWWGGYAKDNHSNANYCKQSKNSLLTYIDEINNSTFLCKDYKDVIIPKNCIVYCDPPYKNTTGYSVKGFNSDEFWEYVRKLSNECIVLISEEQAPIDFIKIYSKELTRTVNKNGNKYKKSFDNLYIHNKYNNIINFLRKD